jgi:predicted nucleic acid-binding protein
VDTGAWKALVDAKDRFHRPVQEEFDRLREKKVPLYTTDYVISETLTLLRIRSGLGHKVAIQFGEMVRASQVVQTYFVSADLFYQAWEIFRRYQDKDFSFVDCTSFALMEEQKIVEALTLDIHFAQYGFQCHPEQAP